jgi:hypothetical protein
LGLRLWVLVSSVMRFSLSASLYQFLFHLKLNYMRASLRKRRGKPAGCYDNWDACQID